MKELNEDLAERLDSINNLEKLVEKILKEVKVVLVRTCWLKTSNFMLRDELIFYQTFAAYNKKIKYIFFLDGTSIDLFSQRTGLFMKFIELLERLKDKTHGSEVEVFSVLEKVKEMQLVLRAPKG